MASQSPPKPPKAGLSLYANLLDPSNATPATGTISRAPVVFSKPVGQDQAQDETAAQKQQISAAALRFQPTKRPQVSTQKSKAKPNLPKATASVAAALSAQANAAASESAANNTSRTALPKTTFADWTAQGDDDDVNGFYGAGEKRQRGGRKKRKKNKEESLLPQNWDDIYDPSRPNNYEEYKNSDEKIREVREWKDRLYAHRMARRKSDFSDSENEERYRPQMNKSFALPPMSFAPPSELSVPVSIPDDATGEDAYTRRMRLSGLQQAPPPPSPPSRPYSPPPPPPEISAFPPPSITPTSEQQPPPPPPPQAPAPSDTQPTASISRAPVRYNLPAAPAELPNTEAELETALEAEAEAAQPDEEPAEDAPRSLRPGQRGFAERLMSKYGWTKGSGLGASGSGIVNPLRVKVEKAKKKSDAEGGGFVGPKGGTGKIIGGQSKKGNGVTKEDEGGKFGTMSEVVVLRGMVDGMDLQQEMEGGLVQEIGEECGEKYGRVERVFVETSSGAVFVKFTSQLSGLRAVNALEGRIFNGNAISARFFDAEKFESGEYA